MDEAYPQADHVTKHRLPRNGSEIASTQWETMHLADAEQRISTIVRRWERVRHGLAAPARLLYADMDRLGRELRRHETRLEAKGYACPQEWTVGLVGLGLGVLALTEYPLTRSAFEWFRLTADETRVVAAGVCLVTMAVAHWLGRNLRQRTWGGVSTLFAVVLIAAWMSLGLLRIEFVNTQAEERRARLGSELAALASAGASVPVSSPPYSSGAEGLSDTSVIALMAVAAIGLTGGVLLGYRAHDPDLELKHLAQAERRTRGRYRRVGKRLLKAASRYDDKRGDVEQQIALVREGVLQTIREHRYSSELWRLPAKNRPPTFAEAVDETVFKERDLGPELLPVALDLEKSLGLRLVESDDEPDKSLEVTSESDAEANDSDASRTKEEMSA